MIPESRLVNVRSATVYPGRPVLVDVSIEVEPDPNARSFRIVGVEGVLDSENCPIRVRSALRAAGWSLPSGAITVSVRPTYDSRAPEEHDLAIALGLLVAQDILAPEDLENLIAVGELGLDGSVCAVRGALPIALATAREKPRPLLVVPAANRAEAIVAGEARVVGVRSLPDAIRTLRGIPYEPTDPTREGGELAEIQGAAAAKRGLEIAAAGGHHTLLIGPPGCGKTMLARRVGGLLPLLSRAEALSATAVHSTAGTLPHGHAVLTARPFRAPHHTVSRAAMWGATCPPRPGEISLAHHGVLFLDEGPEFARGTLEVVSTALGRQEVETRGRYQRVTYPADVLCIVAANPCPCGYHGAATRGCQCSERQVRSYLDRLAPLSPWLDLQIRVEPVSTETRAPEDRSDLSLRVRARVAAAWARQRRYWPDGTRGMNRQLSLDRLLRFCSEPAIDLLDTTCSTDVTRVLRVARTIADLAGADLIGPDHLREAMDYQRII